MATRKQTRKTARKTTGKPARKTTPTKHKAAAKKIVDTTRKETKQAKVIELLNRPQGATLAQLMEATGWQAHTVRGHLSGVVRKKLGRTLDSRKEKGEARIYALA